MNYAVILASIFCSFSLFAAQPELWFNPPPRHINMDQKVQSVLFENGEVNFGITVPSDAGKVAAFGAEEMTAFLGKALNAKIPVSTTRDPAWRYAIILGDCALSRKAGIDASNIPLDGFIIRTVGNDIYIVGQDDKEKDVKQFLDYSEWQTANRFYKRGTLYGVYDFLERFAGVRFYLPNELGTIIPELTKFSIPKLDIYDRPDCIYRSSNGVTLGQKKDWMDAGARPKAVGNLTALRWRSSTRTLPTSHGLQTLGYFKRFGEEHPEYFAMDIHGKRSTVYPGFLCFSSKGLIREIINDAESALRGEPPQKRGVVCILENGLSFCNWFPQAYNKDGFFGVMPMDGFKCCRCPLCKDHYLDPEQIWQMTADVGNALKKDGVSGYVVQSAYHYWMNVPKVELPDNVLVNISLTGAWGHGDKEVVKKELDLVKSWSKKINKKVLLWNYYDYYDDDGIPVNGTVFSYPGLSQTSPIAIAQYYKLFAPYLAGSFMECGMSGMGRGDILNMYMGFKIHWDLSLDPTAVMDEFYQKMFGKAGPVMKQYFTEAENIWVKNIRGKFVETPLGPQPVQLPQSEIWEKLYSKDRLAKWTALFDQAEAIAGKNTVEYKRIKMFRSWYLDPALARAEKYDQERRAVEVLAVNADKIATPVEIDGKLDDAVWKSATPNYLSKVPFGKLPIRAWVKILRDDKNLYFGFESEDPMTESLMTGKNAVEGQSFWSLSTFEIMLNPNNDKISLYHVAITPDGRTQFLMHPGQIPWKTDARYATFIGSDRWSAEIAIPLSSIPGINANGFYANFAHCRQLNGENTSTEDYSWSPYLMKQFAEPDHFGKLYFNEPPRKNLLRDYDFAGLSRRGNGAGRYWSMTQDAEGSLVEFDTSDYITGGQSLSCIGKAEKGKDITLRVAYNGIPLEPGKKYLFSYFMKAELEPGSFMTSRVGVAGVNNFIPRESHWGKFPWTRFHGEFTVPAKAEKGTVGFELYGSGKVKIDHVVLQKIDSDKEEEPVR